MFSGPLIAPPSMHVIITQLVRLECQGGGADGDLDLLSYHINDALFDCIRAAPHPFIKERKLVERHPPPRP